MPLRGSTTQANKWCWEKYHNSCVRVEDIVCSVMKMAEVHERTGAMLRIALNNRMDLNETLSMLAATSETTRSSFSETATALKTIMARTMRIGSLDSDVSYEDMLKTEKALARIGVNIRNLETNEMRNFKDIIQDVHDKFYDLDEATQSYIAETVSATVWQQAEIK